MNNNDEVINEVAGDFIAFCYLCFFPSFSLSFPGNHRTLKKIIQLKYFFNILKKNGTKMK